VPARGESRYVREVSPEPPSRRGRPPVHNRADLLAAASEALLRRGYAGLRYQDVAETSGVAVASLRHYFPTLAGLRQEALKHLVSSELHALREEVAGTSDPWEQVRLFVTRGIALDDVGRRDGWVLWLEYWHAAAHDPEIGAHSREVEESWTDVAREAIEAGVAEGRFHLDQPALSAARELHALMDGFGLRLTLEHTQAEALAATSDVERAARRMLQMDLVPDPRHPEPTPDPAAQTSRAQRSKGQS
jgi:AcrR family transcriptional regulator